MHETSPNKQGDLLKGLLFDPYKRSISLVEVRNDLHVWYKVLRCDCVDVNRVIQPACGKDCVDLWFDDEFLLKQPVGPGFRFTDPDGNCREYHGYCLMLSSDDQGNSTDMALFSEMPKKAGMPTMAAAAMFVAAFQEAIELRWEQWERRLPKDTFIEEQMRSVELEVDSSDFRCLAVVE